MRDPEPVASGVVRGVEVPVCAEAVFRELGYPTAQETPGVIQLAFRRVLSHGLQYLHPSITYRTFPAPVAVESEASGETVSAVSPACAGLSPEGGHTAYFAVTLGARFDTYLRHLNRRGEFLAAMIWDAIGTVATSELVTAIRSRLAAVYEGSGWTASRPATVAGADLPLVLRMSQAERLSVSFSEQSHLLSPSKSCAGCLRIGPS